MYISRLSGCPQSASVEVVILCSHPFWMLVLGDCVGTVVVAWFTCIFPLAIFYDIIDFHRPTVVFAVHVECGQLGVWVGIL